MRAEDLANVCIPQECDDFTTKTGTLFFIVLCYSSTCRTDSVAFTESNLLGSVFCSDDAPKMARDFVGRK